MDASAQFLAGLQQPDGAVGVAAGLATPCWPTAFAALLWSQLPYYRRPLADALRWLQQREACAVRTSDEEVLSGETDAAQLAVDRWNPVPD